jgi:hypothetical protein
MRSSSVTVTTSPTLLVSADDTHRSVYLHVVGNATVYLGSETVTTANGLNTEKHTSPLEIIIPSRQTLYGIVEASTEDVRVLTPDID